MNKVFAIGWCLLLAVTDTAQAETNETWSFSWGDGEYGLSFGNGTNLSSSTKAAIRDDVQIVYENIPASNAVYRALQRTDEEFGPLTGQMFLQGNYICPVGLRNWDYREDENIKMIAVKSDLRSLYLEKIALTNQYAATVSALSNFLFLAQSMTPANTSTNAFLQMFWHFNNNRIPVISDDPEFRFLDYVQKWGGVYYINPSILQFEFGSLEGLVCLHAEIRTVKKMASEIRSSVYVVYKDEQWRFLIWEW
jgi:hypothetical protein